MRMILNNKIIYEHHTTTTCNVDIHMHNYNEIYMALSDNIRYYIEGKSYSLDRGDIIITNPEEVHRPTITNDSPYSRQFIQFSPETLEHFFPTDYNSLILFTNRESGSNNRFVFSMDEQNEINSIFNSIKASYSSNTPQAQLKVKLKIVELIMILYDKYDKNYIGYIRHKTKKISEIISDIEQNYTKPFSLDDFSHKHYIDKYYLCHLFKKETGFTIMEYIHSKRVQKAKNLIINDTNITQVCNLCGFNDYTVFYKVFKKLTGQSPSEFKIKYKF